MAKGSLVTRALELPAFLLGVFMLYWSLPISVLMYKVKFLKLYGKRDDAYGWGVGLQRMFGVKVLQLPGPKLYVSDPIIYLSNHRCWADFFLDVVMTEGHAQMLSRMAVLFVFPAFMLAVWLIRSVVLFKRGQRIDKDEFNRMLDEKLAKSPVPGLIVYPEGHRSTKRDSLPLKRGMLHYVYDRKHPVQIIMTANKEAVLSEKDLRCHLGQTVLVGYSEPIFSAEYPTFEAFLAQVQKSWDAQWQRINSADWSTAAPKQLDFQDNRAYSPWVKFWQIFFTGGSCIAFFVTLYWMARATLAFLALFGAYQAVVTALLAVYLAAALARAFVPVRYPVADVPSPAS